MARGFTTGSSQYFENASGSPVSTYPFAVSARYKPAVTLQDKAVFCIANGSNRHLLYQNQDSIAMFSGSGGTTAQARSSLGTHVFAGTEIQVGGQVSDASSRAVYINGSANGLNTSTVSVGSLNRAYIGAYYSSGVVAGFYANGEISEVGVWDIELNSDEWAQLGAGCSPLLIRPQNLKGYWPLLARATNEEDWVGLLSMTNTNGATAANHPRIILPAQKIFTFSAAASNPDATAAVSQAQTTSASASVSSAASAEVGQAQSTDATASVSMAASVSASQAQSADAASAVSIAATTASAQAQTVAASDGSEPEPDPRYARPAADIDQGAWSPSSGDSLYAMMDEPTADSDDYIFTESAGPCEVQLNPVVDPGTSTGQVVRYQAWSASGDGLTVQLKQGGTVIAEWTHASLPSDPTIFAQALTGGQCDSITDYSDLRFHFEAI